MKFSLKNIFSASVLRLTMLSFSCFLYVYGVNDIDKLAQDVFVVTHANHKDFCHYLNLISQITPKTLGGVGGSSLGRFYTHLNDKKNVKLVAAIKYVNDLTNVVVELAKKLEIEKAEQAQARSLELENSDDKAADSSQPEEIKEVPTKEAQIVAEIKESLLLVFEAHLVLYIALKGFLLEQKMPGFIRTMVVNSLKSIVGHSLEQRIDKLAVIKFNSFYQRALEKIIDSKDTFKEVFARECRSAKENGDYLKALFLALESRTFCSDVVNSPALAKVMSETVATRESLAMIFPEAFSESRSLLGAWSIEG